MDILKGNLQDTPAQSIHRDQCEMIRNNQFGLPSEKLAELVIEESYDVNPVQNRHEIGLGQTPCAENLATIQRKQEIHSDQKGQGWSTFLLDKVSYSFKKINFSVVFVSYHLHTKK